ncbi:hypothetical protein pVa21_073 [Vibrio phage pVa-21]|nr:hypothetical protein pVa21_073 [Vibrio phage pVa-21]
MLELNMDELTVVCRQKPNGEIDITFSVITEDGAQCFAIAMELKGVESIEEMGEWLIMSTVEEIDEKYPDSPESKGRGVTNEQLEMFASSAIVNRVNEILSDVKVQ